MSSRPLVSVIIPVFNDESRIARAINGVINQTHKNLEIIVVDDASTDNTLNVILGIKDERLKILRHEVNKGGNTGGSAPRNTGMRIAKGEYIALHDSDDEWLPEKIEKQLKLLNSKGKDYGVVACWPKYIEDGKVYVKKYFNEGDISIDLLAMNVGLGFGSTMLFKREILDEIGYMDEAFPRHQDFEYMLRILEKYKLAVVKEPLANVYGSSRTPSPEKLVETKLLFLNRFKKLIEKQKKSEQKKIYARHWLQVSRSYANAGDLSNTIKYLFKSMSYRLLFSRRVKVLPLETYFVLPFLFLKSIMRRTYGKDSKKDS